MRSFRERVGAFRGTALLIRHPFWVVALALCLTLLLWSMTFYSIGIQVGKPFPGFFYNPERVFSSFTPRDFTGWQAGLRPWDVIIAVNGQHWREMPKLVREAGVGSTLVYTIERGDQRLEIPVRTMEFTPEILFRFLPGYFLSSLVFLAIGIFIYLRNPAAPLNRYLLGYLLVWGMCMSITWESFLSQAKWTGYLLAPVVIAAPVAGWIFFWTFPTDPEWRNFLDRIPVIRAFVVLAVTAIVLMSGLRLLAALLDSPVLWRWLIFIQGWPYFIVFGLGSIPMKSLPLFAITLRKVDRLARQQAIVMLAGLLLGLWGWYLFVWAPAAVHVRPLAQVQWGSLISTLYPLSIAYAVLRYRLLDIRVVVRKGLIYSLLTATLTAAFLLFSLLSGYIYQNFTGQPSLLAMIIPALLVAFLFQPVRSRIQSFVDRAFFRQDFEVRQALTRFSRSLSTPRSQSEIVQLVRNTLAETLGAQNATIWLLQDGRYLPVSGAENSEEGLSSAGTLAKWLSIEQHALFPMPDDPSLQAKELHRLNNVLAVPLFFGEKLTGILTLEEKRSGELYRQEDLDLLTMLAHSTALAIENARFYEERVDLVRRQFIQAAAIQEEERRRIARDLHDGVGSSLAGLNIRLYRVSKHLQRDQNSMASEVKDLAAEIQSSIRDIRRLVYDLGPASLDELGLIPALQAYIARYHKDQGLEVEFTAPDDMSRMSVAVETTLFRIAQEALANVAKHAQAQHIKLRLERGQEDIILRISDDGKGFEQSTPLLGNHLGLWSMQKRVEQFGGCFLIDSSTDSGTQITVRIPLQNGQAT
jgi:signal transduction histidine kinase